jgi:membrane-bound metal-dependent hydrolase YbcI (DUF457 family)
VCSSPTHDAVGAFGGLLALSLMTDDRIQPAGLLVLVGCTVLMGLAETRASLRCRREEAPLKARRTALRVAMRERGLSSHEAQIEALREIPRPRWDGPPKRVRRRVRMIALVGVIWSAWPVAIAYAVSRLPDQAEVAGIDHRTVTHWLATSGALLTGLWFGLAQAGVGESVVGVVVLFAGIGILGHLWADGITLAGVPFLGPFWRRDLHLLPRRLRVRTGGKADALVMLAASGGTVFLALTMGGWA